LYANLETSPRPKLLYGLIFYLQRLLIVLAVVFVETFCYQFIIIQVCLMLKPLYLCHYRPYLTRLDLISDFSNDLLLVSVHILQVILTLYTFDDENRYSFGWSYNYIIVTIFAFNFVIVGYI
jgi:hypothetical protein